MRNSTGGIRLPASAAEVVVATASELVAGAAGAARPTFTLTDGPRSGVKTL